MRQWRLWRLLSHSRVPLSVVELALKLDADTAPPRTIRRDLEVLGDAVPCEARVALGVARVVASARRRGSLVDEK